MRGFRVAYGRGKSFVVPAEVVVDLLRTFGGSEVPLGLSRFPARGSLNSWLRRRLAGEEDVPAAFVGPVLVAEGVAARVGDALRFA